MQNYYRTGGLTEAASLFLRARGIAVYILPFSDPTLALLLVGFTEYDDDDDDFLSFFLSFLIFNYLFVDANKTYFDLIRNVGIKIRETNESELMFLICNDD
ncbi:hypothetical protein Hanom_Chr13g01215881 [Helianthus anomalus]